MASDDPCKIPGFPTLSIGPATTPTPLAANTYKQRNSVNGSAVGIDREVPDPKSPCNQLNTIRISPYFQLQVNVTRVVLQSEGLSEFPVVTKTRTRHELQTGEPKIV